MRYIKYLLLILCILSPALSWASAFDVSSTDKSMQYLGMVFGNVGSLPISPPNGSNPIFSQLIYIFNTSVFALGILIVIVTTLIGTINTAQEGETLGKKWSSIWIPARAGLGMYLLLPSVGGYNWIQITVMWLIVQGVGAANALWAQVIYSNETQGSLVNETRSTDLNNSISSVQAIFKSSLCMQLINDQIINNPNAAANLNNDFVLAYVSQDGRTVYFGRLSDPQGQPICGSITVQDVGASPITGSSSANDPAVMERRQMLTDAVLSASSAVQPSVNEAIASPSSSWELYSTWVSAARALNGAVQNLASTFASLSDVNKKAIVDGWIHAGSYYFTLVQTGNVRHEAVNFNIGDVNSTAITNALGTTIGNPIVSKINSLTTQYRTQVNSASTEWAQFNPTASAGGSLSAVTINKPNLGGDIGGIFDAIFGHSFFSNAAANFGQMITTGCLSSTTNLGGSYTGDPLICMASFGGTIASTCEAVFWGALIAVFFIWLGTAIMTCVQPVGHAFSFMMSVLIPIVMLMIMVIWSAGITLALYVPMIPFLVFTFSALTWIILVIEAMVGSPLIGLTLVVPSEDEIGKAGHAIVILLGLFLRPALMILGFIFGQKLLMVAIGMLNFGFAGTMEMTLTTGVGLFGFIVLLMLYVGLATSIVHEAFSLIYLLPDKTLRWMGIAGEGSEAGALTKEAEGNVAAGVGAGKGMMSGSLGFVSGKAQKGLKKG